jgi:hypothetical protein
MATPRHGFLLEYRSDKESGFAPKGSMSTMRYYLDARSLRAGLKRACNNPSRQFSSVRVQIVDRETEDVVETRRYTCQRTSSGFRPVTQAPRRRK